MTDEFNKISSSPSSLFFTPLSFMYNLYETESSGKGSLLWSGILFIIPWNDSWFTGESIFTDTGFNFNAKLTIFLTDDAFNSFGKKGNILCILSEMSKMRVSFPFSSVLKNYYLAVKIVVIKPNRCYACFSSSSPSRILLKASMMRRLFFKSFFWCLNWKGW